jgi:hypothetical protein
MYHSDERLCHVPSISRHTTFPTATIRMNPCCTHLIFVSCAREHKHKHTQHTSHPILPMPLFLPVNTDRQLLSATAEFHMKPSQSAQQIRCGRQADRWKRENSIKNYVWAPVCRSSAAVRSTEEYILQVVTQLKRTGAWNLFLVSFTCWVLRIHEHFFVCPYD